jgi:hypothetical protein
MGSLAEVIRRLPESPVDELLLPCDVVRALLTEIETSDVTVGDQLLGLSASLTRVLRSGLAAILVLSTHYLSSTESAGTARKLAARRTSVKVHGPVTMAPETPRKNKPNRALRAQVRACPQEAHVRDQRQALLPGKRA